MGTCFLASTNDRVDWTKHLHDNWGVTYTESRSSEIGGKVVLITALLYRIVELSAGWCGRTWHVMLYIGLPGPAALSHLSEVERLSAERLAAERMALASAGDPMARLQLASAQAAHAHTHTHAHSHTHLHLHQPGLLGSGEPRDPRDPRDPERAGSGPQLHPAVSQAHPLLAPPAGPHPSLSHHPLLAGECAVSAAWHWCIVVTDVLQNSVDPLVARSLALYQPYQAGGSMGPAGAVRPPGLTLPQPPHPASKPPPDKLPADPATQHFLQMSRKCTLSQFVIFSPLCCICRLWFQFAVWGEKRHIYSFDCSAKKYCKIFPEFFSVEILARFKPQINFGNSPFNLLRHL